MSLSQFRVCPRVMKAPRMAVCDISRCYMPLRCEPKGAALDQYLKGPECGRLWNHGRGLTMECQDHRC